MTATIQREWVQGLPSGFRFVLRGLTGRESLFNGSPMGETRQEAIENLATINSRRKQLNLSPIVAIIR